VGRARRALAEERSRMSDLATTPDAVTTRRPDPASPGADDLAADLDRYRAELTGYCYRMLGSAFEAEDAVQETMVRAWRGHAGFEGRSALRSWLYRIATNVCLDALHGRARRAMPMDLGAASDGTSAPEPVTSDVAWLQPVPDARVVPDHADPAETAAAREGIRLAFVAALQHLPARQRAALILFDVLGWQAVEVAALLDTTPTSVHSALQRARARLADRRGDAPVLAADPGELDDDHRALLARYVDAFQRYDVDALVALLHEDATLSMPPLSMWLHGPDAISRWYRGEGRACGESRVLPTAANGCPAFGIYRPDGVGGHRAFAIQVVELAGGRISGLHAFLEPELFPLFGLPARLDGGDADAEGQPTAA
jgi:RNA polymerase sigma-70 factor, ECF subfamily